ncbi:MAG: RNA-directed DNA polymerase [Blastocatellia bacterium]
MSLNDLLSRGYFPKELPNPFVTTSFANLVTSHLGPLPGDLNKATLPISKKPPSLQVSKPYRYSHARGGLLRRHLAVPNPIHFYLLCSEIMQNWSELTPFVSGSEFSATAPVFSPKGRALQGKHPQNRPALARQTRLNNRYILQTDITRFYHSIYTHSIPWAIHTKGTAKSDRSALLLGNRLDYWIRMAQDGQTVGIPIGPDTSLLLAEILMHRCDEALVSKIGPVQGHRFIDDYELGFRDRSKAEDAFHLLESCIGEYELALNAKKTNVLTLPLPLEHLGFSTLRGVTFRKTSGYEASDIQFYFDKMFELHDSYPEESFIQYGVARFRHQKVQDKNWPLLESLLLLCVTPEPACLPYVLEVINACSNAGATINKDGLEAILNALIIEHTGLGHSSEVAWALWGCLALGLPIHSGAVKVLQSCEDSAVVLLALDCERNGLTLTPLDKALWDSLMTDASLYDEHWLFAYEANIKGWLRSTKRKDFVASDKKFGFLKANGVSFYDAGLAAPIEKGGPVTIPKPPAASLTPPDDLDDYGLTII